MCKYTPERIAAAVDLACLKPEATSVDVSVCCQKALQYECASVCVKPYHVPIATRILDGFNVKVGTVVGFPHGSDAPDVKALACYNLIGLGADEIDMVLNIGAMRDADWDTIANEIQGAVEICHEYGTLLKVILETCYLNKFEIQCACACAKQLGVDFVKTSTGFGTGGATPETVRLMVNAVNGKCQVKASGGISTYDHAETFLDLGCTRLGSSRIAELMPYYVEEV